MQRATAAAAAAAALTSQRGRHLQFPRILARPRAGQEKETKDEGSTTRSASAAFAKTKRTKRTNGGIFERPIPGIESYIFGPLYSLWLNARLISNKLVGNAAVGAVPVLYRITTPFVTKNRMQSRSIRLALKFEACHKLFSKLYSQKKQSTRSQKHEWDKERESERKRASF